MCVLEYTSSNWPMLPGQMSLVAVGDATASRNKPGAGSGDTIQEASGVLCPWADICEHSHLHTQLAGRREMWLPFWLIFSVLLAHCGDGHANSHHDLAIHGEVPQQRQTVSGLKTLSSEL